MYWLSWITKQQGMEFDNSSHARAPRFLNLLGSCQVRTCPGSLELWGSGMDPHQANMSPQQAVNWHKADGPKGAIQGLIHRTENTNDPTCEVNRAYLSPYCTCTNGLVHVSSLSTAVSVHSTSNIYHYLGPRKLSADSHLLQCRLRRQHRYCILQVGEMVISSLQHQYSARFVA